MSAYNFQSAEQAQLNSLNSKTAYAGGNPNAQQAFCTMMPPPNVTGALHIGHALVITLQDVLTRYHRMKGADTLWQAGVDHAGIATQFMVEKKLHQEGLTKEDLGYEEFFKRILAWKETSQSRILAQIKQLGASCDFGNVAFTMDDNFSAAVAKVFVKLYGDGLIYQDYRLVNWDTQLSTALSDLEVVYKEENGSLYYINYYLAAEEGTHLTLKEAQELPLFLTVATTRPETMFGDVALAVNPQDARYAHLVGSYAEIPLSRKRIPIIADQHCEPEQGSGVVKITPAHDFNDFEVGQRHALDLVVVIDNKGCMCGETPPEFLGLPVLEARKKLLTVLQAQGQLLEVKPHLMQVPYGDRSGSVIQPLPSRQWFLNVEPMGALAQAAVREGEVRLFPKNWENLYFAWLGNIRPWCISRQLWWGHRLPVWYGEDGQVFVAETQEQAAALAEAAGISAESLEQETSVLDTWFSSALWPFVTLGWPYEDSSRFQKYYPTSTLVTGFDILFFWVIRMIMMGKYLTGKAPFKDVYLHGLVLDAKGQKMSKTKGNVVDPLDLSERYGTDALRFALVSYASGGQNIRFSEKNLESARNFVTKIWNAYRFLQHYECLDLTAPARPLKVRSPFNIWALNKFDQALHQVNKYLGSYQFNEVAQHMYHFVWDEYCDWYIEFIKIILTNSAYQDIATETKQVASYLFRQILHFLHPVMPFVTQHIHAQMPQELISICSSPNKEINIGAALEPQASQLGSDKELGSSYLFNQSYPQELPAWSSSYQEDIHQVELCIKIITAIRSLRALLRIKPKELLELSLEEQSSLQPYYEIIKRLARLSEIHQVREIPQGLITDVVDTTTSVGLRVTDQIDRTLERQRLANEIANLEKEQASLRSRLANTSFVSKAPPEILEQTRGNLTHIDQKIHLLLQLREQLQ